MNRSRSTNFNSHVQGMQPTGQRIASANQHVGGHMTSRHYTSHHEEEEEKGGEMFSRRKTQFAGLPKQYGGSNVGGMLGTQRGMAH